MKMQDKELDELFRANLDDLELKPSPNVWAGIDAELEKGRRRKIYTSFFSIAASIVVLFTMGYLFVPKKIHTIINTEAKSSLPRPTPRSVKNALAKTTSKTTPAETGNPATGVKVKNIFRTANPNKVVGSAQTPALSEQESDEQLASANNNNTEIIMQVQPGEQTQIAAPQPVQIKTPLIVEPKQIIAALPAINDRSSAIKSKTPTLSLGGLINAMVAKVDKRKDKVIEFTDDDGDSNITGVNLGIIKIKKDQQPSEK